MCTTELTLFIARPYINFYALRSFLCGVNVHNIVQDHFLSGSVNFGINFMVYVKTLNELLWSYLH